jgi:hypothetical protein
MKYVLVSGGVISGVGKGIIGAFSRGRGEYFVTAAVTELPSFDAFAASSTGLLLKTIGLKMSREANDASCRGC